MYSKQTSWAAKRREAVTLARPGRRHLDRARQLCALPLETFLTELWPPPCRARRSRRSWPSRQSAGSAKERRRAASDQRPDHSRRKPAAVWQQAAQRRRRRRTMPRAYICVVSRRATAPSCSLGVSTAARRAACGAARPRSSTRSSSRPNSTWLCGEKSSLHGKQY